jgi:hypothetical protein
MKKAYSTQRATAKFGVSFSALNRWLARGLIRSSMAIPIEGVRTLWRCTDADIAHGRKVKAAQHPGPKPKTGKP